MTLMSLTMSLRVLSSIVGAGSQVFEELERALTSCFCTTFVYLMHCMMMSIDCDYKWSSGSKINSYLIFTSF